MAASAGLAPYGYLGSPIQLPQRVRTGQSQDLQEGWPPHTAAPLQPEPGPLYTCSSAARLAGQMRRRQLHPST
ncbi:hypothetical protein Cadr_000024742 [Camelus dromedarius]|uniref:Uncharacterized protein n=1 Tax=Camelus dromedarius TaxID=9838 RepID=A0A5N4CQ78_CAMDR|nr:hypothetical protein Cadr_000024742 [Camelus dromedarius]